MDQALVDREVHSRSNSFHYRTFLFGMIVAVAGVGMSIGAFYYGQQTASTSSFDIGMPTSRLHPEFLQATASHGSSTLAVCTGQVDENAEGFFTLDYMTGELNAWVYYPRQGAFGGRFNTNVTNFMTSMPGKNAEYLLVTGGAAPPPGNSQIRAAACIVYVVDVVSGEFAAFTIPWSKSAENSAQAQMNQFGFLGRDAIRPMMMKQGAKPALKPNPPPNNPNVKPNNANNANANNANANNANGDPDMDANNGGVQQPPRNNPANNNNRKNPK